MPGLNTPLHLKMLDSYRQKRPKTGVLRKALEWCGLVKVPPEIYGYHWGNPETDPRLMQVRDQFVLPYVEPTHAALEIGSGGGRWTRYLLGFGKVHAVDYHQELLDELRRNFDAPNLVFVRNNGTDFPGIENGSIDFIFSFGTFVHLDLDLIEQYLGNMKRVLRPNANVVIQYADGNRH